MRAITLVGGDGTSWDLGGGDVRVAEADPMLWGMPPVGITDRTSFAIPGSTVTHRRHAARDLVLPLLIMPDDPYQLENVLNRFARAVDPVGGDVTLIVTRGDGSAARQIVATYMRGLDGISVANAYSGDAHAAIALRANDPYWQSIVNETITVTPPPPVFVSGTTPFDGTTLFDADVPIDGFFTGAAFDDPSIGFDDRLPFDGAGGGTLIFAINNAGDVDAWPTMSVKGPSTWVEVTNLSTGEYWQLPTGLPGSGDLEIVTKPGQRSIRLNGVNVYGSLAVGSTLWGLPPGESVIAIRFDGTLVATSKFTFAYVPRYLTC